MGIPPKKLNLEQQECIKPKGYVLWFYCSEMEKKQVAREEFSDEMKLCLNLNEV